MPGAGCDLLRKLVLFYLFFMMFGMLVVPSLLARGCTVVPSKTWPPQVPLSIDLYSHASGTLLTLDLEDYVIGVVAAEMPALFHPEALKAQAIAARTYAVIRMRAFGGSGVECHPEADICDEPSHVQAWISESEAKARWGALAAARNWAKTFSIIRIASLCDTVTPTSIK